MIELRSVERARQWREGSQGNVGFVPTMGALHDGHISLIRRARRENDAVAVSLFVNPTQFNDPRDLERYPRPLDEDLTLLRREDVHAVFLPSAEEMYSDAFRFEVREKDLSRRFCGAFRPGHFEGVLTVVLKLLSLIRPRHAYFGEKDFQQYRLIQSMANAFFLPTEIVGCPTVREADGLAMSSRNARLDSRQREIAARLPRVLRSSPDATTASRELEEAGFSVEYVEDWEGRRLAAANLGDVRLIDNVEL